MSLDHDVLVAERKDDTGSLVPTAGQPTRLQVDQLGYLKVTPFGTPLNGQTIAFVSDTLGTWPAQEMVLTLRAILNHLRALTTGTNVDESAPIQGVR